MAYKELTIYSYNTYNALYLNHSVDLPDAGYPDNGTYLTTRNAVSSSSFTKSTSPYYVGQDCTYDRVGDTYDYSTHRMTIHFRNALNIKAGAPIEYALLEINKIDYAAELAATYVVTNGQPDYPHAPPVAADFDITHYSGNGGEVVNPTGTGWKSILLNADGRSWINFVGYAADYPNDYFCRICLQSQDDIDGVSTGTNLNRPYIGISGAYNLQPRLTIRITLSIPTAETEAATNVDTVSANLHGKVLHNGYWLAAYGFEWKKGIDGSITSYQVGTDVSQLVSTFNYNTDDIFESGTLYYYRAWASNDAGKGYGEWVAFTTLSVNAVTTQAATQIGYFCAMGNGTTTGANATERGFEILLSFIGSLYSYIEHSIAGFTGDASYNISTGHWEGTLTKTETETGDFVQGAYTLVLGYPSVLGNPSSVFNDKLFKCESYTYRARATIGGVVYYGSYVAFDTLCDKGGDEQPDDSIDEGNPIEPIIPIIPPEEYPPFIWEPPEIPYPPWDWDLPPWEYPDYPPLSFVGDFYYRKPYTQKDLDELRRKCIIYNKNSVEFALVLRHNTNVLTEFFNMMTDYMSKEEFNDFTDIIPPQRLKELYLDPLEPTDFRDMINEFIRNTIDNNIAVNRNFNVIQEALSDYETGSDNAYFTEITSSIKQLQQDNPDVERMKILIDSLNDEVSSNFSDITRNLGILREKLLG